MLYGAVGCTRYGAPHSNAVKNSEDRGTGQESSTPGADCTGNQIET